MARPTHPPLRAALATAKRKAINAGLRVLPDRLSVQAQYWRAFHRWIDLDAPKRFTEKLQWLKLYGGLEAHSGWVDKLEAKRRVAALLGDRWITPTLWHGPALPPRAERTWPLPYLIKANHGSGLYRHVVFDSDKDWPAIERQTATWLRTAWHPHLVERQYCGIPRELFVEPRLGGTAEIIPYDYKFHVFNGVVRFCGVSIERLQGTKLAVMDRDWTLLPFTIDDTPASTFVPERPPHFEEMWEAAALLAKPFPYARIDLYDLPEGPRFGEITLTPASGHLPTHPDEWDYRLGDWLELPSCTEGSQR
jgi:hypothetical protein